MDKKQQRNLIIIAIILLLLFFISNKKEAKQSNGETPPPPPPPPPSPIYGCMDINYENYNPNATTDDGSCANNGNGFVYGCTDPTANNYNPNANTDNGLCTFESTDPIYGCTDPTATNYDPNANADTGCFYTDPNVGLTNCTNYDCSNFNYTDNNYSPFWSGSPNPLPIVEASNTNYLLGVDPVLRGDYKLYYICCPYPITENSDPSMTDVTQQSNHIISYDYNNLNNKKWAILQWQPYQDPYFQGGTQVINYSNGTSWTLTYPQHNVVNGIAYNNAIDWLGYNPRGISWEIFRRSHGGYQHQVHRMTMRNRVNAHGWASCFLDPSIVINGTDLNGTPCGTCAGCGYNATGCSNTGSAFFNCRLDNSTTFIGTYADGSTRVIYADPYAVAFPLTSAYDPYTGTGNSPLVSISATFMWQPYWYSMEDPEFTNFQTYTKIFNIT